MADTPVQPPLAKHDSKMLDLAFAMDTTGSMGSYIDAARDNVRRITEEIVAKETCDVRLALVNYRDHPPQVCTVSTTLMSIVHSLLSFCQVQRKVSYQESEIYIYHR